jgi:hypothetical protein
MKEKPPTTVPVHGIQLVDDKGRPIEAKQVRATVKGGDIFLSWDIEDLPPQKRRVELTIVAEVSGFELRDLGKTKPEWAAYASLKVERGRDFKLLPLPPKPPGLFDGEADKPKAAGNGSSNGTKRSARTARTKARAR